MFAQSIQLNEVIKENTSLKTQVTDLQHTCDRIESLMEVALGMKSNVDDKSPGNDKEDVPIIYEQVPDFETLKINLNTKNLKQLVFEMLTNKCRESFDNQSPEESKKTRRVFTNQKNVVDIFVKFMGNRPLKPINVTQLVEWKDTMRLIIKNTYEVVKDYMHNHELIQRKTKRGDITVAMLKTPGVKKHFANLSDITWEVRTNSQDDGTNNATTLQETQDESVEVEEV